MNTTNLIIILYCKDQTRSTEFYTRLLNKVPTLNVPGMTEFQISDNTILGLMPESGIAKILNEKMPHPSKGNGIPRCELYIYSDDIASSILAAIDAGAKIISESKHRDWGDSVAYFSDPDGHIIAIADRNKVQ